MEQGSTPDGASDTRRANGSGKQSAGLVIALCAGHRCAALTRMCGGTDLAAAVARSRGGVLVSAPCLGQCAQGPVGVIALRSSRADITGPSVWLGGLDSTGRLQTLSDWVEQWQPTEESGGALPQDLDAAVLGSGPPIRLALTDH